MKKEKKKAAVDSAQSTASVDQLPNSTFARVEQRVNTADTNDTTQQVFVKKDEQGSEVPKFLASIKVDDSINDILSTQQNEWTTVIPSNLVYYISFKYSVEDLKKAMEFDLPKEVVSKVTLTNTGAIRLFLDKDKLKELPDRKDADKDASNLFRSGLIDKCHRDILSKLNLNKFPEALTDLSSEDGNFKLVGRQITMDLDGKKFIVNRILPGIIREEVIKGYPLSNIEVTPIKISGDFLYFATTFKNSAIADGITISNKSFVAARFSMTHENFAELAKNYLDAAAPGSRVKFASYQSVTSNLSEEKGEIKLATRCINTNTFEIKTIPMINIAEATSLYKHGDNKKGFKNPLLTLSRHGSNSECVSFNGNAIRKKLGLVLDSENVLTYNSNDGTCILPNVKKLILASIFDGELPPYIKVSYSTDNTSIAFDVTV
jgi:hypothetical protein